MQTQKNKIFNIDCDGDDKRHDPKLMMMSRIMTKIKSYDKDGVDIDKVDQVNKDGKTHKDDKVDKMEKDEKKDKMR